MATSGAIRAGKAFVELFADTGKLGPTLAKGKEMVKGWAKDLNSGVGKVQGLTDSLEPLATKSTAVADAIDMIGTRFGAFNKLSPAARGFANVATSAFKATDAIKQNAAAMAALSTGQTALSLLISPWGLIAAGAVAAGAAFVKFTDVGQGMYASLSESLGGIKDEALDTFSAIANAVEAGDIAAAWDVLQSTVEVLWDKAMVTVIEIWGKAEEKLIDGFYGLAEVASFAWDEIQKGWIDMTVAMLDAWQSFYKKFVSDSTLMQGILEQAAGILLGPAGGKVAEALRTAGIEGPDRAGAEAQKKQIDKEGRERADSIREQNDWAKEGIKKEFDERLRAARERLEAAQERRRGALARAKGLTRPAASAEEAALGVQGRESIAGTFSATAAGRLGGGVMDQIAGNTAQSAKYLKQIAQSTPTIGFT